MHSCVDLAVAWSGQLLFDAICFLLTLQKSFTIGRSGQRTLIHTLLRDGKCGAFFAKRLIHIRLNRCCVFRVSALVITMIQCSEDFTAL